MQTDPTRSDKQTAVADAPPAMVCFNCRAEMPSEMRFCRACGFRLGEGVAEFTETVRFEKTPTAATPQARPTKDAPAGTPKAAPKWYSCANTSDWGALAKKVSEDSLKAAAKIAERHQQKQQKKQLEQQPQQKRHRSRWLVWLIIIMIISIASSGGFMRGSNWRGLRDKLRGLDGESGQSVGRSWVGTSDFESVDNGVTFDKVEPAGSPADKAGLVGGDVVTTFDLQPVKSPDNFRKLLAATPIGKTVDVTYIRDGETKTTKLTTISGDEIDRLEEAAGDAHQGYVGIGGSYEHIQIPGTKISGIQLNNIRRNNPGYIAGLRDGDIIIEFDGVPIRTYSELESRTRRAAPESIIKVVVMRGSERLEIPVTVGEDD